MHLILTYNALTYPPNVGYDATAHLRYVRTLADFRLPTYADTGEFFSPPLPYLPAALGLALGAKLELALKLAQLFNVFVSLWVCASVTRLARALQPESEEPEFLALFLLSLLPCYYRSFAMIRGEPFLTAALLACAAEAESFLRAPSFTYRQAIRVGIFGAASVLSRQWAIPAVLGMFALFALSALKRTAPRANLLRVGAAAMPILVSCLPFYAHLQLSEGTALAFNVSPPPPERAVTIRPTLLELPSSKLMTNPIRPELSERFPEIMYADMWGDYWCYFLVWGELRDGKLISGSWLKKLVLAQDQSELVATNYFSLPRYLGAVNVLVLVIMAAFAGGTLRALISLRWLFRDATNDRARAARVLLATVLSASWAGYLWFLLRYSYSGEGVTVKATYMLQTFPLIALLGADALLFLKARRPMLYRPMIWAIAFNVPFLVPLFFARYT